jgi:ubiquinone/menaquinone biosynthesis C-methylase UbiE
MTSDVHRVPKSDYVGDATTAEWEKTMMGIAARSNYKAVWDKQAQDPELAKHAVAGYGDEDELNRAAADTLALLRATVGLDPNDLVLEIGCGVGRVGGALAPLCRHWFGADISGEMLKHAAKRLARFDNVTLVELPEVSLAMFPDNSLDLVYCTVVFMHLYEWDRYAYVKEMLRVLRPGGRCYFDNLDIATDPGWQLFSNSARFPIERRPAHLSMVSSAEELETYAKRAGFVDVKVHRPPQGWAVVAARKA